MIKLLVPLLLATTTTAVLAQPVPDYGHDFVTVGAAGNRNTIPSEVPEWPETQIGAVAQDFRITRTEVTVAQWYDFVVAYQPHYTGNPRGSSITGGWLNYNSTTNSYSYNTTVANFPVAVTWYDAARYTNWLNNDRRTDAAAFVSGAYDTSTFTTNPDGTRNDQAERSAGARYWLPSNDEWTKATFYDPNRYGTGVGGYWLFTNASDQPPISGLPGTGATTNWNTNLFMDVGSYPGATSPWGLLDTSGSESEWTESVSFGSRLRRGTSSVNIINYADRIDGLGLYTGPGSRHGFRVTSSIPSPSGIIALSLFMAFRSRRVQR